VEYTYDNLNRKTAHIQHKTTGNLTVSYTQYDQEGNLERMTDAMGRLFTYAYDRTFRTLGGAV
jgi:YD repeat-containing protein